MILFSYLITAILLCLFQETIFLVIIIMRLFGYLIDTFISLDFSAFFELVCSSLSLAATIIIACVQYKQTEKMSNFERRLDCRDELRHNEQIEAQAAKFISEHREDIRLIPLCVIASIYNNTFYYSRPIYRDFCYLTHETQNKILAHCHLNLDVVVISDFYDKCIDTIRKVVRDNFPNDKDIFYENGKYVSNCLLNYGPENFPYQYIPYQRFSNIPAIQSYYNNNDKAPYEQCICDTLSKAFSCKCHSKPITYLADFYCFNNMDPMEACQFVTTVMLYIAHFSKNTILDYNYEAPLEQLREEGQEVKMEDLFLLALYETYIRLIL